MVFPWHSTCLTRTVGSVEDVLDRSLGIYSTQPTGHLELLARLDDYRLDDLDRVMVRERKAVSLRTLRGSGFVVPVELLPVTQAATRSRNVRSASSLFAGRLKTPYETWAERILDVLADGPLASTEIRSRLEPISDDGELIRYVVGTMATENRIVAAGTTGSWRSDRTLFARWSDWLPGVDVWSMDEVTGRTELARLYLDRHGPATVADFSFWSGLPKTMVAKIFGEVATPHPDGDTWSTHEAGDEPAPFVRLLPIWDTLFVTYRDRSRFVADEHYSMVYDASGNATSVVLVDGRAAGVWDLGKDDRRLEIKVASFVSFTKQQREAISVEANRIGDLVGSQEVVVLPCRDPVDLVVGPRNAFMSPLRHHTPVGS